MTTPITFIDRDEAIAPASEAEDLDEIELLRREIIRLTTEIDQKQQELFAIQSSLAGNIQA